MLEDTVRLNLLYDYYGNLLTENQKKAFDMYYRMDFTLSEIAEEIKISKQGVSENLKRAVSELEKYESELKLLKKSSSIRDYAKKAVFEISSSDYKEAINLINKIIEELDN